MKKETAQQRTVEEEEAEAEAEAEASDQEEAEQLQDKVRTTCLLSYNRKYFTLVHIQSCLCSWNLIVLSLGTSARKYTHTKS